MTAGVSTAAGAKLFIGTTALVGATDTFVEVGEITGIPEFGRVYNEVKYSPLNSRGVQKFKGSFDDGSVSVPLGKDLTDDGQAALVVALDVDADYNFKVVDNDDVPPVSFTGVSMTAASPGVVTATAHGLAPNTSIVFPTGTTGLPTGVTAGTTYYVKAVLTADTFTISTTPGGTALVTTGSPTGTYSLSTVPQGSTQVFKAKVMSHTTKRDNSDSVIMSTVLLSIKSGSIVETAHLP
jgi:hypothetical protein